MKKLLGIGAQIALIVILLPTLACLLSIIPGAGEFVYRTFLETLGTIPIFDVVTQMIGAADRVYATPVTMVEVVRCAAEDAAFDTLVISLCITIALELNKRLKVIRNFGAAPTYELVNVIQVPILPTILGATAGVLLAGAIRMLPEEGFYQAANVLGVIGLVFITLSTLLRYRGGGRSFLLWHACKTFLVLGIGLFLAAWCAMAVTSLLIASTFSVGSAAFNFMMFTYFGAAFGAVFVSTLAGFLLN